LLMGGIKLDSSWTTLLPGFIVGGIGIGLVNAPLASTSVSVVEPRQAGMASGINNTFRQVGIATGIAALGAIFQSRISSHLAAAGVPAKLVHPIAQAISSGQARSVMIRAHGSRNPTLARASFISGLNEILLVASFVLFAGAVLAFLLVRRQDCVAAPAGAIGSAAEAAEATRNASASTNDPGIERALRSRKTATARRLHEAEISNQAAHASLVQCVCSATQRPKRQRVTHGRRAIRGRKATMPAAATPAAATTAK